MPEEQNSLELLILHELAIRQLYALFAEMLPEQREFWGQMRDAEQKHADCLQELSSKESLQTWTMTDDKFKRLAIKGSLDYLERQTERARTTPIDPLEALSIAGDIEEALIEKQLISLNISGPAEIRNAMRVLVADTQRHRKMIGERLSAQKRATR